MLNNKWGEGEANVKIRLVVVVVVVMVVVWETLYIHVHHVHLPDPKFEARPQSTIQPHVRWVVEWSNSFHGQCVPGIIPLSHVYVQPILKC